MLFSCFVIPKKTCYFLVHFFAAVYKEFGETEQLFGLLFVLAKMPTPFLIPSS